MEPTELSSHTKLEFRDFKELFQNHVAQLLAEVDTLFLAPVDKEVIWDTYLESFPLEANPTFRERRVYDCSCCRHFIRSFGGVVAVDKYNKVQTIWGFETSDSVFQPVLNALDYYVKSLDVSDVFVTHDSKYGTDKNYEKLEDNDVRTWEHFYVELPKKFVSPKSTSIGMTTGQLRDTKNVLKRSFEEITKDALETVLDLVSSNTLYKGKEWEAQLNKFLALFNEYHNLPSVEKDNYCWRTSVEVGASIGRIRNHSIGVLLTDLSSGTELEQAVKRYEQIVAPTNYKRPKAIFTKKMLEEAQQKLVDLGLMDSLGRRHAVLEDISVNNILFANRDVVGRMTNGDVFADLMKDTVTKPQKFDRVESITWENFVSNVLPRVTSLEVYLENKHTANMVSLIAPVVESAPTLFKWNNAFSWAYQGNITDSMKERVKAAGGNVTGVLRFSIQWNEEGDNQNDFDAHCVEPTGRRIFFENKARRHPSSGMLDVDIIHPGKDVAVENIIFTDAHKMPEGEYEFSVHTYTHNGGMSGFRAEIEFDGQIHSFEHNKGSRYNERVVVAKVEYTRSEGFKMTYSLPSSLSSREIWGLSSNQFQPVSVLMYSPNYWDEQKGLGHRHLFFMLEGCTNDTTPNGFFNEFLREDLMPQKKVFEALGGRMRVESSLDQLSGVGFSTTKRDSVVCKLGGNIDRVMKITF